MRYKLLIFILIGFYLQEACKKCCQDPTNPECENYDPCFKEKEIGKGFTMMQPGAFLSHELDFDTDTSASRYITFKANFNNALSYEWHIGSGIYTSKSQEIDFPYQWVDDTLKKVIHTEKITLIQKRIPNPKCIPNDDGLDTFVRYLTFGNQCHYQIYGKFRGEDTENPGKTYDIEITKGNCYPPLRNPNNPLQGFADADSNRIFKNFRNKVKYGYFAGEARFYNSCEFQIINKEGYKPEDDLFRNNYMILSSNQQDLLIKYSVIKPQYIGTTNQQIIIDSNSYNYYTFKGKRIF
jgi:hypothetical protein